MTSEAKESDIIDALDSVLPRIRENGLTAEENSWIPSENVDLLDKAGVFRVAVPERFGGLDLPLSAQVEVIKKVSRACGSTGWVVVAWVSTAWMASLYSDRTQGEVFSEGSVRVSGGFTPSGTLVPDGDGYLLNGKWRFNSGCRGAHWDLLAAHLEGPDGTAEEAYALVPMDSLKIADDWDTTAASGTGSATTVADNVWVPSHRVITTEQAVLGTTEGRSNSGATGRNYSLISYVVVESAAAYVGMARGALDSFLAQLSGRPLAYSTWEDQRAHPMLQHSVAAAANRIDAAEALLDTVLPLMQRRADSGEQPTTEEKARIRGVSGSVVQLTREAVDALYEVSSGSSIVRRSPFQRFRRDLHGLALHGMMTPMLSLEAQGQVLIGLEPETPYL